MSCVPKFDTLKKTQLTVQAKAILKQQDYQKRRNQDRERVLWLSVNEGHWWFPWLPLSVQCVTFQPKLLLRVLFIFKHVTWSTDIPCVPIRTLFILNSLWVKMCILSAHEITSDTIYEFWGEQFICHNEEVKWVTSSGKNNPCTCWRLIILPTAHSEEEV